MNRLMSLIVALAAVLVIACGGSTPTGPTKVCMNPNAPNYGQEGDCLPVPTPTVSSVSLVKTTPTTPAKLKMATTIDNGDGTGQIIGGEPLLVTVKYTVAAEHAAKPDEEMYLTVCLSVDGKNHLALPFCWSQLVTDQVGQKDFRFIMTENRKTNRTEFVFMGMYTIKKGEVNSLYKLVFSGFVWSNAPAIVEWLKP